MITRRSLALAAATGLAGVWAPTCGGDSDHLHMEDLRLFDVMLNRLSAETEPLDAAEWHFENASLGRQAHRRVYSVSPADSVSRLEDYPRFYASLRGVADRVVSRREDLLGAMRAMRRLVPQTPRTPVYFFVSVIIYGVTPR